MPNFLKIGYQKVEIPDGIQIVPTFQYLCYIFQILNGKYKVASILVNVQMVGLQGWYV